jgi:hypothetical protein
MGKDLRAEVIEFFLQRMNEHSKVARLSDISDHDNLLFRVERGRSLPDITVHLSDAYCYTIAEYLSRPSQIQKGDFILVAKPEGSFVDDVCLVAKDDCIGIGKLAKFMGALNHREVWNYEPPQRQRRLTA